MSEKIKGFDPDFWKNPELWKIGKGYVETRAIVDLAIFQTTMLMAEGIWISRFFNSQNINELGSTIPVAMLGVVAGLGVLFRLEDAIIEWKLSEKVVEKGGVDKMMLREASNMIKVGYVKSMQFYSAIGKHKESNDMRKVRDDVEHNLGNFAEKVMNRESRQKVSK